MRLFVHNRVRVFTKKRLMQVKWKSERMPHKTALRVCLFFMFFSVAKILLNCVDVHAHADLELCWSYVFLHVVTYFV